jgi:hypothetical protein
MTLQEARERARKLGLSTWVVEAIAVGEKSEAVDLMCVGFASIGVPIAEGENWDEAIKNTVRIIFAS